MKKYTIEYKGSTEFVYMDSFKDVRNWLRRKFNKKRLHGIKIRLEKNNYYAENLKPVKNITQYQQQCSCCKRWLPEEEITVDDEFIANFICEDCYKTRKQI